MEWSFDGPNGVITVRREGDQALCRAIHPDSRGGLWKAWLLGTNARFLLGTLIPEGGALRLRRTVTVEQLERQGVWPPTGAELVEHSAPLPDAPPPGWRWADCPGRLMGEPGVRLALQDTHRALLRREEEGFLLALPFGPGLPFPIPSLFCLCRVERLEGKNHAVFRFSRRGCPILFE